MAPRAPRCLELAALEARELVRVQAEEGVRGVVEDAAALAHGTEVLQSPHRRLRRRGAHDLPRGGGSAIERSFVPLVLVKRSQSLQPKKLLTRTESMQQPLIWMPGSDWI